MAITTPTPAICATIEPMSKPPTAAPAPAPPTCISMLRSVPQSAANDSCAALAFWPKAQCLHETAGNGAAPCATPPLDDQVDDRRVHGVPPVSDRLRRVTGRSAGHYGLPPWL